MRYRRERIGTADVVEERGPFESNRRDTWTLRKPSGYMAWARRHQCPFGKLREFGSRSANRG